MKRYLLLLIVISLHLQSMCFGQGIEESNLIRGKTFVSIGTTLKSSSFLQGSNGLYKELAIDYGIANYLSVGIFAGRQKRNYSFLSVHYTSGITEYEYSQTFIPTGVRLSMHLNPFINNHLGINFRPEKWDVYIRYFAGVVFNNVTDKFDRNVHTADKLINYAAYRTDEDLNYKAGLMTGVKFFPLKNIAIFFEGGLGNMGHFNVGVLTRH